jgi:aromatic ring hydroxylase
MGPEGGVMSLMTPADYAASLNDGRKTYWDGEDIPDITKHPRFRVPIALTAEDYNYDDRTGENCAASRLRMEAGRIASIRSHAARKTSPNALNY